MASVTSPAQLDGLFKQIYADNIQNLIPETARLVKDIKFVSADKETGNKYNQPVVLSNEQGISFGGASAGAFSLNSAVALTMKNAQLEGSQMVLRSSISYDAASKASNSKKAFVRGTEFLVENMMESMTKFLEIALLYGGKGTGSFNAITGSSTARVVTCTTASFAAGIWSGTENAVINFYTAAGALVSSGADADFIITSVDITNKKLTLECTSGGGSALDSAIGSAAVDSFWKGAYGNEMTGLDGIITNATALFGIDASVYSLWAGNSHACGGAALTLAKVLSGLSKAVERGLNEDVYLYTNPITWSNLNSDQAALRSYDYSYKPAKSEAGSHAIEYHGNNGKITVVPHNCVKEGEAFALPLRKARRIGSSEITFKRPGRQGEDFFRELSDSAGYELRSFLDQSLFIETPARTVKYTGIVNS
ncbi:MAG: hypothetical protein CMN84_13180 [Spongiibacteraceae bacterium]|nr:hypothetical protein [Spongiibacteraceae bacterium]